MKRIDWHVVIVMTIITVPSVVSAQMTWTCETDSTQWHKRWRHSSVTFDDKMWVMAGAWGSRDSIGLSDVWNSTDGENWTQATANANWSPRFNHASVCYNNKMWIIGGLSVPDLTTLNDVWYSADGYLWNCATPSAQWQQRDQHTCVVFDNKIWIMGGSNWGNLNDVWYSIDGVNWTEATSSAQWSPRERHASVVYDNRIWVIGGSGGNDVWYSYDGTNWVLATDSAGWLPRQFHSSVVFDNKMWVIGGLGYWGVGYASDVWYSTDGIDWIQACSTAEWSPRVGHTSVVYDNKMWVIGGYDGDYRNDVWCSSALCVEEQGNVEKPLANRFQTIFSGPLRLPEGKTCRVFDITGRVVEPATITPGVYFVEIDGIVTQKVVKVR